SFHLCGCTPLTGGGYLSTARGAGRSSGQWLRQIPLAFEVRVADCTKRSFRDLPTVELRVSPYASVLSGATHPVESSDAPIPASPARPVQDGFVTIFIRGDAIAAKGKLVVLHVAQAAACEYCGVQEPASRGI